MFNLNVNKLCSHHVMDLYPAGHSTTTPNIITNILSDLGVLLGPIKSGLVPTSYFMKYAYTLIIFVWHEVWGWVKYLKIFRSNNNIANKFQMKNILWEIYFVGSVSVFHSKNILSDKYFIRNVFLSEINAKVIYL